MPAGLSAATCQCRTGSLHGFLHCFLLCSVAIHLLVDCSGHSVLPLVLLIGLCLLGCCCCCNKAEILLTGHEHCCAAIIHCLLQQGPYLGAKMLTCSCCAISRRNGSRCDMLPAFSWKNNTTGRCFTCCLLQSRGTSSHACNLVPSAASNQTSCRPSMHVFDPFSSGSSI